MTIGRIDSTPSNVSLMDLDQQLNVGLAGDSGAEIAALLVLGARDARNQAKASEQAEERQLTQLEDQQVRSLYQQADATRSAGWAKGAGQILSGGATAIGAGIGADTGGAEGQMQSQAWAGEGNAIQGGLNFVASSYEYEANISGAQATDAGNKLKHVERRLQELAQEQSDAAQLTRTAIQAASDLSRAETTSDQATIFLRG